MWRNISHFLSPVKTRLISIESQPKKVVFVVVVVVFVVVIVVVDLRNLS